MKVQRHRRSSSGARARWAAFAVVASLCLGTSVRGEANGFKFGDARLHPFLELEPRYDSAASLLPSPANPLQYVTSSDLLLHIRPGLKLEMPSPTLGLNLNANVDYVRYTGLLSNSGAASYLGGNGDLDVMVNKDGQVSLALGDHVIRSDRPRGNPTLAVGAISLYNDAHLKLNLQPYKGSITISPAYHFTAEMLTANGEASMCTAATGTTAACDKDQLGKQDYLNHTFMLNARWRFLPKTALVLDSALGMRSYSNPASPGIMSLKATLGAVGLLTSRIEAVLRAGWGQDFTSGTYASVIAQAEVGYIFSETGSVHLGYMRTFEPSGEPYISFGDDRIYANGRFLLGGKLVGHGTLAADLLSFRGAASSGSQVNSSLDLGADYEVMTWVSVGVGYRLTYIQGIDMIVYGDQKSFVRNEAYLGLKFAY